MTLLWVMMGSAAGAMARLWVVNRVQHQLGHAFPWGTLVVNATGAVLIGLLAGGLLAHLSGDSPEAWSLAITGLLGSYTTVSSFSVQTLALWQAGQPLRAGANIVVSVVLCLGGVLVGLALAGGLTP
ncbi:MAG: fluoride efflux transporter CrcB [Alcanivoracaceae bacterium]